MIQSMGCPTAQQKKKIPREDIALLLWGFLKWILIAQKTLPQSYIVFLASFSSIKLLLLAFSILFFRQQTDFKMFTLFVIRCKSLQKINLFVDVKGHNFSFIRSVFFRHLTFHCNMLLMPLLLKILPIDGHYIPHHWNSATKNSSCLESIHVSIQFSTSS